MKNLSKRFIPNVGTLIILGLFLCAQAVGAFPFKGMSTQSTSLPRLINYQGRLNDAGGNPVPDGSYTMTFRLYSPCDASAAEWTEIRDVTVSNGLFNVMLGEVTDLPAPFPSDPVCLGVKVGSDEEMTPRERLGSVPFALVANVADGAITTAKLADGAVTTAKLADNSVTRDKLAAGLPLPSGTVVMWSGSLAAIPESWTLCDGTNGTPDLRDKFIVGAGNSYSAGDTGGAASVTLTTDQMPAHSHSASTSSDGGFEHSQTDRHGSDRPEGPVFYGMGTIYYDANRELGDHTHAVTVESTGGGQPHENRPPYYSLAFICKE